MEGEVNKAQFIYLFFLIVEKNTYTNEFLKFKNFHIFKIWKQNLY